MKKQVSKLLIGMGLAALLLASAPASAVVFQKLNVDGFIFQDSDSSSSSFSTDPTMLSGRVWYGLTGTYTMTLVVQNTSDGFGTSYSEPAEYLLTGIGFNTFGKTFNFGTVDIADLTIDLGSGTSESFSSTALQLKDNGTLDIAHDDGRPDWDGSTLDSEYGYDDGVTTSGEYKQGNNAGFFDVNLVISAMESQTTTKFDPFNSIDNPFELNGPEFGAVSATQTESDPAGGLEAIRDSIVIVLTFNESLGAGYGDTLDTGDIILSFGSPTNFWDLPPDCGFPGGPVCGPRLLPEPGTMLMFAFGLLSMVFIRRRIACRA